MKQVILKNRSETLQLTAENFITVSHGQFMLVVF